MQENIKEKNLIPDPRIVGNFIPHHYMADPDYKFLWPNSWVFHDEIVQKVIQGDYFGITPYSAEFVTTLNCPNRCHMCSYKSQKELTGSWEKNVYHTSIHINDINFAKNIVDKLKEGGIKGIIFTGGGEPFLFPNLEKLVSYTTSLDVDAVVYTSGVGVNEKRANQIIASDPLIIRQSFNAANLDDFNNFFNPKNKFNSFNNALNSLYYFAKGAKQNPKVTFGVGILVNEINTNSLPLIASKLRDIDYISGGGISFATFRPQYDYVGNQQLTSHTLNKAYKIIENQVRAILEGTSIKVNNVKSRFDSLLENTRDYSRCLSSGLYAEVSQTGEVHICCDRNCHPNWSFGDLTINSLKEIYKSEKRKALLDYVDSNINFICPPACKPHETNRQFGQIEKLRQEGKMSIVIDWINAQRALPKPKMVNF